MTTPLLQNVARFDGGGEIFGFGGGGYKESWPWCSLFDGFPSLFVAPSGEKPALPMCWKGTSLSTISRVFVHIFFFGQSVVVDVEGVGIRPGAVVAGSGVVAVYTHLDSSLVIFPDYDVVVGRQHQEALHLSKKTELIYNFRQRHRYCSVLFRRPPVLRRCDIEHRPYACLARELSVHFAFSARAANLAIPRTPELRGAWSAPAAND